MSEPFEPHVVSLKTERIGDITYDIFAGYRAMMITVFHHKTGQQVTFPLNDIKQFTPLAKDLAA